jgi:hypothetical protein
MGVGLVGLDMRSLGAGCEVENGEKQVEEEEEEREGSEHALYPDGREPEPKNPSSVPSSVVRW